MKRVREWQSRDVEVLVSKTDVGTLEGAKQLIKEACALGPVGGVFHLAMVTSFIIILFMIEFIYVLFAQKIINMFFFSSFSGVERWHV